jgi:hypothetical protein
MPSRNISVGKLWLEEPMTEQLLSVACSAVSSASKSFSSSSSKLLPNNIFGAENSTASWYDNAELPYSLVHCQTGHILAHLGVCRRWVEECLAVAPTVYKLLK